MKVINDVGKKTILLVDDEDYLVDILKKLLVWQGYYVLTVKNGLEAVEAYKAKTEKIDIILMDIIMPKMSGVEALVKIKDYDPYVPIILMSGFAEESVEGLPHTHFIRKPMQPQDLFKSIEEVLEESDSCYC